MLLKITNLVIEPLQLPHNSSDLFCRQNLSLALRRSTKFMLFLNYKREIFGTELNVGHAQAVIIFEPQLLLSTLDVSLCFRDVKFSNT
jgi:hypothetical protein